MRPGAAGGLAGTLGLLAAGWLAIAVRGAPIGGDLGRLPGPDLLLCVVALWAVRRPDGAPIWAAFLLGLAQDLLSGGPVGAGALALLLAAEWLRGLGPALRRRGFLVEWGAVAAAAAGALALVWALLGATFAPTPPASSLVGGLAATALAYPAVALALRWAARPGPAVAEPARARP